MIELIKTQNIFKFVTAVTFILGLSGSQIREDSGSLDSDFSRHFFVYVYKQMADSTINLVCLHFLQYFQFIVHYRPNNLLM